MINQKPDFLVNANNVYRTRHYIIKQTISVSTDNYGNTNIYSDDVYYLRNKNLDKRFNECFADRILLNGKRLHTTTHTKRYV